MKKQMITASQVTARSNEETVVFIIGVRINKWPSIHRWLPVVRAMTPCFHMFFSFGVGHKVIKRAPILDQCNAS